MPEFKNVPFWDKRVDRFELGRDIVPGEKIQPGFYPRLFSGSNMQLVGEYHPSRAGKYVLDYLNCGTLFGISTPPRGTTVYSVEREQRFAAQQPTQKQHDFLDRIVQEVIINKDINKLRNIEAEYDIELKNIHLDSSFRWVNSAGDSGDNWFAGYKTLEELESSVDEVEPETPTTENTVSTRLLFTHETRSIFDLFVFECFTMVQEGTKVCRCAACGKYFFPKSLKAKFCSDQCRTGSFVSGKPAYKAYDTARNGHYKRIVARKDAYNDQGELKLKPKYDRWVETRKAKMHECVKKYTGQEFETTEYWRDYIRYLEKWPEDLSMEGEENNV